MSACQVARCPAEGVHVIDPDRGGARLLVCADHLNVGRRTMGTLIGIAVMRVALVGIAILLLVQLGIIRT